MHILHATHFEILAETHYKLFKKFARCLRGNIGEFLNIEPGHFTSDIVLALKCFEHIDKIVTIVIGPHD
jgi:hypothetical protein